MANFIQGPQHRQLLLGRQVTSSLTAAPQSTSTTLFTVTGGMVMVTSIVGIVTTVIGSTTVNYNLTHTPTGGSAADLVAATACTSDAVGTIYSLVSGVATDLLSIQNTSSLGTGGAAASDVPTVTYAQLLRQPIVLPAGAVKWKTSASTTGAVTWKMTYVPYDTGAAVTG